MTIITMPQQTAVTLDCWNWLKNTYECDVIIAEEPEGYSVHAVQLAGVVSVGDTIDEAIANISEALRGSIQEYLESNEEIPWREGDDEFFKTLKGKTKRRIAVDV